MDPLKNFIDTNKSIKIMNLIEPHPANISSTIDRCREVFNYKEKDIKPIHWK